MLSTYSYVLTYRYSKEISLKKLIKKADYHKRQETSQLAYAFSMRLVIAVAKLNKTSVCILTKQPTQGKRHTQKQIFQLG